MMYMAELSRLINGSLKLHMSACEVRVHVHVHVHIMFHVKTDLTAYRDNSCNNILP